MVEKKNEQKPFIPRSNKRQSKEELGQMCTGIMTVDYEEAKHIKMHRKSHYKLSFNVTYFDFNYAN